MLGVCYRYSKTRAEAEDLLQEGFIKVFQKINSFEGKGSFEGWLRRIMVNNSINNYKSNLKHYFHEEINDQLIATEKDNDEFEIQDFIKEETLIKYIQDLPTGYKMVFNMYAIDGLSHKEIADELNISINTSKTQLFKARKHLRIKLKKLTQLLEFEYDKI